MAMIEFKRKVIAKQNELIQKQMKEMEAQNEQESEPQQHILPLVE